MFLVVRHCFATSNARNWPTAKVSLSPEIVCTAPPNELDATVQQYWYCDMTLKTPTRRTRLF